MIKFNELRVTSDGKKLIIDTSVKDLQYYNDVYIDAIIIDTQDTYVSNGPSTNPIFHHEISISNEHGPIITEEGEKRVRLELDSTALGVSLCDTLFFVYVIVKGTPSVDTPCGMDNQTTMGVVANLYPFYRAMVNYMKEVEDECEIPKNFIDALLRFKALELSIRTGHYAQAIKYWNKLFMEVKSKTINTRCRCHGWT